MNRSPSKNRKYKPVSNGLYSSSRISCRLDSSFVTADVQNSVCFMPEFPPPPQLGNAAKQVPTTYSWKCNVFVPFSHTKGSGFLQ